MDVASLYTTWPDLPSAETVGNMLVAQRLAACVNILPGMRSIYRWNGSVERADEVVMLVKTTVANAPLARDAILAAHPYETPCVLHLHIDPAGSAPEFLAWITAETK